MGERLLLPNYTREGLQICVYNGFAKFFPLFLGLLYLADLELCRYMAERGGHLKSASPENRTLYRAPISFTYNRWPEYWINLTAVFMIVTLALRRFSKLKSAVADFQDRNRDFYRGLPQHVFSDDCRITLPRRCESFIKITARRPGHSLSSGDNGVSAESSSSQTFSSSASSSEYEEHHQHSAHPHSERLATRDPENVLRHIPRGGLRRRPMLAMTTFAAFLSLAGLATQALVRLPDDALEQMTTEACTHHSEFFGDAAAPRAIDERSKAFIPRDREVKVNDLDLQEEELDAVFDLETDQDITRVTEYPVEILSQDDLVREAAPFLLPRVELTTSTSTTSVRESQSTETTTSTAIITMLKIDALLDDEVTLEEVGPTPQKSDAISVATQPATIASINTGTMDEDRQEELEAVAHFSDDSTTSLPNEEFALAANGVRDALTTAMEDWRRLNSRKDSSLEEIYSDPFGLTSLYDVSEQSASSGSRKLQLIVTTSTLSPTTANGSEESGSCLKIVPLRISLQAEIHSIGVVVFILAGWTAAFLMTMWCLVRYLRYHGCVRPALTFQPQLTSIVLKLVLHAIPGLASYYIMSVMHRQMHDLEKAGWIQQASIAGLVLFLATLSFEIKSLGTGLKDSYYYVKQNHIGRRVAFTE